MNHRLARIGPVAVLAATGPLSVVPPASASTVTIGSSLGRSSNVNGIGTGSITVQRGQVGGSGPHPLTSPANGPGNTAIPGTVVPIVIGKKT